MAPFNFSSATLADFQRLRSDPRTVVIKWRASPNGPIFIVKEAFPLRLAITSFPTGTNVAAFPDNRFILITGGNYHAVRDVFIWMLRWADGDKALPAINEKPFLKIFRLRQAAHILGAPTLVEFIDLHIKSLTNIMPKPEDVEAVYGAFNKGHPARSLTTRSIATAIVGGTAKVDDTEMEKLCERRKDLLEDINAALPEMYARKEKYDASIEKGRADAVEKQKAEARARGEVKAQQLKDQIQKSLDEIRKLNQIKKERDEAVMGERNALGQQKYERLRAEERRRHIMSKPASSRLFPKVVPVEGTGKAREPTKDL